MLGGRLGQLSRRWKWENVLVFLPHSWDWSIQGRRQETELKSASVHRFLRHMLRCPTQRKQLLFYKPGVLSFWVSPLLHAPTRRLAARVWGLLLPLQIPFLRSAASTPQPSFIKSNRKTSKAGSIHSASGSRQTCAPRLLKNSRVVPLGWFSVPLSDDYMLFRIPHLQNGAICSWIYLKDTGLCKRKTESWWGRMMLLISFLNFLCFFFFLVKHTEKI